MAKYWDSILIDDVEIFIQIHTERRRNTRATFGKDYLIIRVPSLMPKPLQRQSIDKMKRWAVNTLSQKPELLNRYQIRNYHKKPKLTVMDTDLEVQIVYADRKSGKGSLKNHQLVLTLPEGMDTYSERMMTRTLISRTIANYFKPLIEKMIDTINDNHFQEDIKSINLKYNTSNWGSCSTQRNINLSTRLLLAPTWVIEYVIIHEMSHLREMNHSPRFWAIVAEACPDYKKAEAWLKKYSYTCYF